MSHFTVLVIGNEIEKQLEPYWERYKLLAEKDSDE